MNYKQVNGKCNTGDSANADGTCTKVHKGKLGTSTSSLSPNQVKELSGHLRDFNEKAAHNWRNWKGGIITTEVAGANSKKNYAFYAEMHKNVTGMYPKGHPKSTTSASVSASPASSATPLPTTNAACQSDPKSSACATTIPDGTYTIKDKRGNTKTITYVSGKVKYSNN